MVENVVYKKALLAIIIRSNYQHDGITFFTPNEFSQQLGYMCRPKGYTIEPHIHKHLERKVFFTQEVLVIKRGMVRVDFYDERQFYIESRNIYTGDVILLASGGHGFEILEDAEIIEIKQGPYNNEKDKVRFTNVIAETGVESFDH
jgi:hypothetical protein